MEKEGTRIDLLEGRRKGLWKILQKNRGLRSKMAGFEETQHMRSHGQNADAMEGPIETTMA